MTRTTRRARSSFGSAASACAGRPAGDRRRQRRHADAAAAGLARRSAGRRVDARRRRIDPPPAGRPDGRAAAADGRRGLERATDRLPPLTFAGAALKRDRLRDAGRQRAGEVVPAARRPARRRRDDAWSSRARRATTRSACCAPPGPRCGPSAGTPVTIHGELPATRVTVEPAERLEPGDDRRARRLLVGRLLHRRARCSSAAARSGSSGVGHQPGPDRAARDPQPDGRRDRGDRDTRPRAASRWRRSSPARDRSQATRVGAGEVPLAIDELPLVALAGCFAEGETMVSGAEELRHKESDRIATVVDGLRGARRRDRGDRRTASLSPAPAGCAAARSTPPATTGWRCSARSRGSRRARGSRSTGFEAAGVSYPGFEADLRDAAGRASRSARVPVAGPGGEHEQEAGVLGRRDLVALVRVEDRRAGPGRR